MNKKHTIFKQFKTIYSKNPWVCWIILWVSVMPSIGSLLTLQGIYQHWEPLPTSGFLTLPRLFFYLVTCSLLMGLALLPTTFLAVLSGFIFGWATFPFLVLSYTLASVMGYLLGRNLDQNSLGLILKPYPKAAQLIHEKREKMGWLVFYVRISPVVPFALSNILFALLRTGIPNLVWAGLVGMLPRTFLAFLTGTWAVGIYQAMQSNDENWQILVLVLLFIISAWGIYRFFKGNPSGK
ncbi:MAG: VTT domain-containing protein [Cyclobacteriaceae bacterium]